MSVRGRPSQCLNAALSILESGKYLVVSGSRKSQALGPLAVGDKVYVNAIEFKDMEVSMKRIREYGR